RSPLGVNRSRFWLYAPPARWRRATPVPCPKPFVACDLDRDSRRESRERSRKNAKTGDTQRAVFDFYRKRPSSILKSESRIRASSSPSICLRSVRLFAASLPVQEIDRYSGAAANESSRIQPVRPISLPGNALQ